MFVNIDREMISQVDETSILQQTAFWAKVKRNHGLKPEAFSLKLKKNELFSGSNDHRIFSDDLLIFIQPVDREHSIAYVPYGPKAEPDDENQGTFLEELSESLRPYLPDHCIMIRYDLPWESQWAKDEDRYDENGNWTGPPQIESQEMRLNFNTHNRNLYKSFTDILPSHTIFLDLEKDKDDLLLNMKPKTRYNIKLSYKRGVEVKSVGPENLDVWYELYKETSRRNRLYVSDKAYFEAMLSVNASEPASSAELKLLLAEAGGEALAAMFLTISGQRGTYLYGASSSVHRNYMATYALQWEAMKLARANGCREYDLFGISPNPNPSHPLYGLYRYKSGFGGEIFHRMGCWDYPLDREKYFAFRAADLQNRGIHAG